MRILMLGNSYTAANDLPALLASRLGAEVVQHTRGGARLAEQLNPKTKMGARTQAALVEEQWDYVILQEMSNAPISSHDKYIKSVTALCEQIRANGAVPVIYATWAYERNGKQLQAFGMDYDEMAQQMMDAFKDAQIQTDALLAEVGKVFYAQADKRPLYANDGSHPNEAGSQLAAEIIADVIQAHEQLK